MDTNQENEIKPVGGEVQTETQNAKPRSTRGKSFQEILESLSTSKGQEEDQEADREPDNDDADGRSLDRTDENRNAHDGNISQNDEIARLKHELSSVQGRLKPTQQRLDALQRENANLRNQLENAQRRMAEFEEVQKELEELRYTRKAMDVKSKIQERFPDVDPDYAEAIVSAVSELQSKTHNQTRNAKEPVQETYAEPAQNAVVERYNQILADTTRNIGSLRAMAGDPDFRKWVESRPEVGAVITVFTQSTSVQDVDKYAEQIDRYMDLYFSESDNASVTAETNVPVKQPEPSINRHTDRNGNRSISRSEYEKRRANLMFKIRSNNVKVRDKAIKELQELQSKFRN